MYLRWKKRRLSHDEGSDRTHSLSAVLVENQRVNGKPRQRYIRHLATIQCHQLADPRWRSVFWTSAERRLADVAIDPALREKVTARLAEVVKPLNPPEQEGEQRRREEEARFWVRVGGR